MKVAINMDGKVYGFPPELISDYRDDEEVALWYHLPLYSALEPRWRRLRFPKGTAWNSVRKFLSSKYSVDKFFVAGPSLFGHSNVDIPLTDFQMDFLDDFRLMLETGTMLISIGYSEPKAIA